MLAPASLLDLTPLTDRAERLVKAARAAGADSADAVALRTMSLGVEVRDGRVEESESSEGDDIGLRVLVGHRQAMVSTNDISDNSAALAQRAVAMARATPEDKFAGLAEPGMLARDIPDLDLIDPKLPTVGELERKRKSWKKRLFQSKASASRAARLPRLESVEWCWLPATVFAAPISGRIMGCR